MAKRSILNVSSLANTLWNLEEARLNGVRGIKSQAKKALTWVAGRYGQPGAYARALFAPAKLDFADVRAVPTGEGKLGRGGAAHVLGEEAVRALALWNYSGEWNREATVLAVRDRFGLGPDRARRDPGLFCCAVCSVARWRALAAAKPNGWEDIIADGLQHLAKTPLAVGRRWKRFPFYYTLLALSELPLPEVESERKRILPAVESVFPKVKGNSQPIRFRRRALEWALG